MSTVHPAFLFLLPLFPLLAVMWFLLHARAQRRLAAAVPEILREKFLPRRRRAAFNAQLLLLTPGLMLLAFAASRPQWGHRDETVTTRGRNLLVAVDVSRSMLARDVHPNRLGRAKADLRDLVAELQGDRAAILAFRRAAALLCPLTTDTAFLLQTIENLSPDRAPPGPTDLAAAIHASLDALDAAQDEFNAILLISDGEELTGESLDAARLAARRNIPIFTVGIGNPAGAPIPDDSGGLLQHRGQTVQSALDEKSLRAIADASGGRYVPLATAGTAHTTLGAIYRNHLRTLAAREQQEIHGHQIQERYNLFLIPGLLLLLAAIALSRGRLAPAKKNVECKMYNVEIKLRQFFVIFTFYILHSTFFPAHGGEVTGAAAAREAQSLLRKNKPLEAAQGFERASQTTTPDRSPPYALNAALAYLKAGETENSIFSKLLLPLVSDPKLGARANDLLAKAALGAPATNAVEKLAALTAAAGHLRQSLRGASSATREQNFARVAPLIPQAREDARIEALLARHEKTPPQKLLAQLLANQRKLHHAAPGVFTNAPAALIPAAERLAQQQRDNADIWIPLKPAILEPITNETERAGFEELIGHARDAMTLSADQLDNLDPAARESITLAETLPYRLWFLTAEPPALVDEDLLLQTNTLASADAPLFSTRPDQPEAHRLTQRLREVFPEWAEQQLQQAAADTNMTFTAEDRDEILRLAAETEDLQYQATLKSDPNRPALQAQALQNLQRIKELLPKQNKNQNQQQQQQEQQPEQDPSGDEQSNDPQEEPQPDEQPGEQPDEQPDEQPQKEYQPDPQTAEKILDMLRRALEREQEHEAEKLRKNQPPTPVDKDW